MENDSKTENVLIETSGVSTEISTEPQIEKTEYNPERIFKFIEELVTNMYEHYFSELENNNKDGFEHYYNLVKKIKTTNDVKERSALINGMIIGFNNFLTEMGKYSGNDTSKLLEVSTLLAIIPRKLNIKYKTSEKIFIPISTIIRKADEESKLAIGQYIFSIDAKLNPSKEKINQLSIIKKQKKKSPIEELLGLPEGSEQAEGFNEILIDIVDSLENSGIDPKNAFNGPANTMKTGMAIFNSGIFTKLDQGFKSGKLLNVKDPKSNENMRKMLHNLIDKGLAPQAEEEQPKVQKQPDDIPLD